MEDIKKRFANVLVDTLDIPQEQIHSDARFKEDLNVDSLDMMELILALEKEFNIQIPDEAIEEIKTIGNAEKHISTTLSNRTISG